MSDVRPAAAGPTPTDAAEMVAAVVDEVAKAVVGKRSAIELVMAGLLADGHVLLDDVPGVAKTLTARSIATAAGLTLLAGSSSRPICCPADITGVDRARPAHASDFAVPARADLRLARARRRDQPGPGQDPVGAARGDAGAPDHRRRRRPTPCPIAVPRHRHPEPDRVGGHVSAARGPARPVHPADRRSGYPNRGRRGRDRATAAWTAASTRSTSTPCSAPASSARMQHSIERVDVDAAIIEYVVDLVAATRRRASSPWVPARVARWPSSSWPGRGR